MQHDWVLDVLADLKSFAQLNGLGALAEQLDDTMLVAAVEVGAAREGDLGAKAGDAGGVGNLHRALGAREST